MGIIIKQTIRGSIWSYLGVGLGFITTTYFYPNFLTTDIVGLLGVLLAYSALFAQISSLGILGVTGRLFPYFRNKENGHNGFLFMASAVLLLGFTLFFILFEVFRPVIIESNLTKSGLFVAFINLLVPITFFTLLFSFLDIYSKLLYDAVFPIFLQEFVQRLFLFIIIILKALNILNLNQFIIAFSVVVSMKSVLLFFHLLWDGEINLKPHLQFLTVKLRKEILSVGAFSILTGMGAAVISHIDKIIVNQYLGLSDTGVYTIAFFFGTLVIIPSRPLLKIAGTLIAEAWKDNDFDKLNELYYKSCLNQFIVGGILFIGIWANIDNILIILGEDYVKGKWVIFFIGIGYLFDMLTGANTQILGYSKYYKVSFYFLLILIVLVILNNVLLIPLWGITGAAAASAISLIVYNIMRFLFLYKRYKMQPFSIKFIMVLLIIVFTYIVSRFLPHLSLISDILIRSTIIVFTYGGLIYILNISEDVTVLINLLYNKIRSLFKS